jgi:branched-chain amino acid transport system substrate-binding protein
VLISLTVFAVALGCPGAQAQYTDGTSWDYFKVRATIPADQAFRPLSEGGCPLMVPLTG